MVDEQTKHAPEVLPEPPEGCTCIWANSASYGGVYITMDDCPAKPHPRRWRAPEHEGRDHA